MGNVLGGVGSGLVQFISCLLQNVVQVGCYFGDLVIVVVVVYYLYVRIVGDQDGVYFLFGQYYYGVFVGVGVVVGFDYLKGMVVQVDWVIYYGGVIEYQGWLLVQLYVQWIGCVVGFFVDCLVVFGYGVV